MGLYEALVVFIILQGCSVVLSTHSHFMSNFLPVNRLQDADCDRMMNEVRDKLRKTEFEHPPKLTGKWVSEGCETRAGPEYLLRSYSFAKNNTFRLLQFHYGDESCTLPMYTVSARGYLRVRGSSWWTPGGTNVDYTLTKVTVLAQSSEMAEELSKRVNKTCPGFVKKSWRSMKEYVVYDLGLEAEGMEMHTTNHHPSLTKNKIVKEAVEVLQNHYPDVIQRMEDEVDCLSGVNLSFHELQLVRVQKTPNTSGEHSRHELLLGDIHSRPEMRDEYRPTAFQTPLLKSDQTRGCAVCHLVAKGTEKSPPHLLSRPRLPPYLDGEWVSNTCEVRTLGMFLTRRLAFDSRDSSWTGEYKFYSDPHCSGLSFAITAAGRYSESKFYKRPYQERNGDKFDFEVEKAYLTLEEMNILNSLRNDRLCGTGTWNLGVPRDLLPTQGCLSLGIVLPVTEFELIKLEISNQGIPLLLMGQPDTENRRRSQHERPTSYQPPLVQCRALPLFMSESFDNYLHPVSNAMVALPSTSTSIPSALPCSIVLFVCLCFLKLISV